jgi:DNA-binding response OmpR family regulator
MTSDQTIRVLIVDDEPLVQRLICRAMQERGIQCGFAADGNEAVREIATTSYDAVVTDLRMPNKHGHSLALHLLELNPPPVLIIHTGVVERKLATDLLARGVDDIVFKPIDFGILAAKVQALVLRRRGMAESPQRPGGSSPTLVERGTRLEGPNGSHNLKNGEIDACKKLENGDGQQGSDNPPEADPSETVRLTTLDVEQPQPSSAPITHAVQVPAATQLHNTSRPPSVTSWLERMLRRMLT